jgi:hypothetical protein
VRRAILFLLLGLTACGDPGLRDRSLMGKLSDERRGIRHYGVTRGGSRKGMAQTSVIGLAPDQLAQYYPDEPTLVVRFKDLDAVGREVAAELDRIRKAFPGLKLPPGTPVDLLRRALQLPDGVLIDPVRPFAFARTSEGWAAILPTRSKDKAPSRLRQLDAVYCVAGDPKVVQSYQPGFRKGFYLPGDLSVIAAPEALGDLGASLGTALAPLGIDLAGLAAALPPCPTDVDRLDFAVRLQDGQLRIDARAAPDRDSPTAVYLERLRPRPSGAVRWLPSRGTAYIECLSAPLDWEALFGVLFRSSSTPGAPTPEDRLLFSFRRFLAALGHDVAMVLHFVQRGSGSVLLVGETEDPAATAAFLGSEDLQALLTCAAGPDGTLAWTPNAFESNGVPVGMIQGNLSRSRLLGWRHSKNVFLSTFAVLSSGPVVAYTAIVGDKVCVAVGPKSRTDMELLIEHVQRGNPVDNEHSTEATALFPQRVAAVSGDLGAVFDGCVEAAPYWRNEWAALRTAALRLPVPVSAAVTVEGGALRLAVNVRPAVVAEALARLKSHLAASK